MDFGNSKDVSIESTTGSGGIEKIDEEYGMHLGRGGGEIWNSICSKLVFTRGGEGWNLEKTMWRNRNEKGSAIWKFNV